MEKYLVLNDWSGKLMWSDAPENALYKKVGPTPGEPLIINGIDFNEILENERARMHAQINMAFTLERMGFYDCKLHMGCFGTLNM